MHFVKGTTTSTRRRFRFVYSTVNHTAPIFKMGFSFTEQASCGKASILLTYNVESLSRGIADSFEIYANTHSHCRGHRFESGMLHSRTCRLQVLFSYIEENMQESFCKSCKMGTPFRDVPQFIPQLAYFPRLKTCQRKASIFDNSSIFVSMLEWA